MPRNKRSRKPGQIGTPKNTTQRSQTDAKKRKISKGHASGSRNSVLQQNTSEPKHFNVSKDTRHGSKKKISLLNGNKQDKIRQSSVLTRFKSPYEELDYIENDRKLQSLLNKVDQGATVDKHEQQYMDTLLDRHKLLCDLFGIHNSDQKDDIQTMDSEQAKEASDDLLDRLDHEFKF